MGSKPEAVIVVPCYNEEARLDADAFMALGSAPGVRLLFVDDGSRDGTADVIRTIAARAADGEAVVFDRNRGKAEAVRSGMLRGIEQGASIVGFLDADLSTSVDEALRLLDELRRRETAHAVLGSRVALAGRMIDRDARRHYFGRVFATAASLILRQVVYDTQCGAKLFRVTDALRTALADPFLSRWAFDVELLGRLLIGTRDVPALSPNGVVEVPLERWIDVAGSKLSAVGMLRTGMELMLIERDLARRRSVVGMAIG